VTPLGPPLHSGDRLGDFALIRQLGEGGMGIVYLAEDKRLGRQVAVKVIAPQLAHDREFQRRFEVEARSAAAIEHPNAVAIYSAGSLDDQLYIAMRYIEGTDLRRVLADGGALDPAPAVAIIADIAAALDAAHSAGLVHRDVKPGNILLSGVPGHGDAYLTDFGLTRGPHGGSEQLTGTGQWIGTLDYVAPEQMANERIDARTDVYALGCVLYEMLAGAVPFAGNDLQKVMAKANQPIPPLPRNPEFDSVIGRSTARDPDRRFRSAGDLARATRAALEGKTPQLTEQGVATGAAAAGLLESSPAEPPTRPLRDVAPQPPPPLDPPTRRMPISGDSPPGSHHRDRGGLSGRTAAVFGGSVVLAAGLIAGALIVSGKGGSDSRTVVNRATTTVAEASTPEQAPEAGVSTTTASSSAASPSTSDTSGYNVAVPPGWTQGESEKVARDGSYVENTWVSPAGDEEILIDQSAGEPSPPAESAEAISTDLESAEEPIYAVRDNVFKGGTPGSEIDFQASSGLRERSDFFFDRGGSGFAVLASAEDQATARSLIGPTVSSLHTTG
jgi:serine/threonine protein kinase